MKNQQGDELAGKVALGALLLGALVALFAVPGCKTIERVIDDPSRLCLPGHVLTTEGCVLRPPVISEPPAPPAPPIEAVPTPPPGTPGPIPSPQQPEPAPAPTVTPAPAPLPPATPTPTPKPGVDPCLRAVREVMDQYLAYGHLTKRAGTTWYCNEDGHRGPECHDYATGAKVDPNTGAVVRPGPDAAWYGVECSPAPPPGPAPTPAQTPVPQPGPTPATCPRLVRWGLAPEPFAGTCPACTYDTTPRFERWPGDERGFPCNGEHDACGGRKCEDPRGLDPARVKVEGGGRWKVLESGYQIRVEDGGAARITVCPRVDLQDAEGRPVAVVGDGCDTKVYR